MSGESTIVPLFGPHDINVGLKPHCLGGGASFEIKRSVMLKIEKNSGFYNFYQKQKMNKNAIYFIVLLLLPIAPFFTRCASNQPARRFTYEQQLLLEANAAFDSKRYEDALFKYEQIRKGYPKSHAAKMAQYKKGIIYLMYDNPNADWSKALEEFKYFQTQYPNDKLCEEVNTWIRILTVIQSFDEEYRGTANELRQLQKLKDRLAIKNDNLDLFIEALRRCKAEKDSLDRENERLKKTIQSLIDSE